MRGSTTTLTSTQPLGYPALLHLSASPRPHFRQDAAGTRKEAQPKQQNNKTTFWQPDQDQPAAQYLKQYRHSQPRIISPRRPAYAMFRTTLARHTHTDTHLVSSCTLCVCFSFYAFCPIHSICRICPLLPSTTQHNPPPQQQQQQKKIPISASHPGIRNSMVSDSPSHPTHPTLIFPTSIYPRPLTQQPPGSVQRSSHAILYPGSLPVS